MPLSCSSTVTPLRDIHIWRIKSKIHPTGFWGRNCHYNPQGSHVPHPPPLLQLSPWSWSLTTLLYHRAVCETQPAKIHSASTVPWELTQNHGIFWQSRWHLTQLTCFKTAGLMIAQSRRFWKLKCQLFDFMLLPFYYNIFLLQRFGAFFIASTRTTTESFGFLAASASQGSSLQTLKKVAKNTPIYWVKHRFPILIR